MDWVACIGVDWGDTEHAYEIEDRSEKRRMGVVQNSAEAIHEWVRELRQSFPVGMVIIAVEQGRGGLLYALSMYDFIVLIPINTRASKMYRGSLRLSGASSDGSDAKLICDFALKHMDVLRAWRPDDPLTRKMRLLVETRRTLVDQRTAHCHTLSATLKSYFPQALQWFGGEESKLLRAMVRRYATLDQLRRATAEEITATMKACRCRKIAKRVTDLIGKLQAAVPLTNDGAIIEAQAMYAQALVCIIEPLDEQIARYDTVIAAAWAVHPDRELFDTLPGAGAVLAPRLAVAFGLDRSRYESATDLQCYSGIAPVQEQSGKSVCTHVRLGCPKFLRQSFHEFAAASMPHSSWARAVYDEQRERGAGHHEAVRALAFRWIRILFRLWQNGELYDEQRHLEKLTRRQSPIIRRLVA